MRACSEKKNFEVNGIEAEMEASRKNIRTEELERNAKTSHHKKHHFELLLRNNKITGK